MPAHRRIGLFGGAFDPPHLTHVNLAKLAVSQFKLDELLVLPTGTAWHKARALSSAADRLAMAELAFADLAKVRVDGRETQRSGPSYTMDTLTELQQEQPGADWFLILGEDQAQALPGWHRIHDLLQCATVCIARRQDSTGTYAGFDPLDWPQARFLTLQMPPSGQSATQVRAMAHARQDVSPLVGPAVARYIVDHALYQTH